MKIRLLLFLLVCTSLTMHSQQTQVSGIVLSSEDNYPIVGANVLLKGQNSGTSTDFDGNFQISANKGAVLVFSYIGFETQEVVLADQKSIQIVLKPNTAALDEIVVIGYGTQTKKEVTGAVSVVDSKVIEKLNPVRVEQALQGQVSGVNITSSSGSPGSGLNIRIRGISTNGDSRPLILVDGNIIEDLSVINPNDIKSVNVLKDATAGIYGVLAANGVILIETKTGRKNSDIRVSVDSYIGFQTSTKKIDLIDNVYDFANYVNSAAVNGGLDPKFATVPGTRLTFFADDVLNPITTYTDWQDAVFDVAPMQNANVNFSGGTEKLSYSFGASYLNQDGIVGLGKSNFNRTTARTSLQYDVSDKLKVSATGIYTSSTKNNLPEGYIGSVLYGALNSDPITTTRSTETGSGYGETLNSAREVVNPLAMIENTYNTNHIDKISATFGINYELLDGLKAESRYQFNHAVSLSDVFRPVFNYGTGKQGTVDDDPNIIKDDGNAISHNADIYDDYKWENFLTYSKVFRENHSLNVVLGTSIMEFKGRYTGRSGRNLINNRNTIEDAIFAYVPPENIRNRFNEQQLIDGADRYITRLFSIFSRVQYNFKGKYLLSAVLRRDGSSKFGPANRFGYFPSASIGWNVSEENFLADNSVISYLKLRASYGTLGNDRISLNRFVSLLDGQAMYTNNDETDADDVLIGTAIGKLANPEIRWESTTTGNIGIDAKFFNDDLSISADVFSKRTQDLLVQANVSGVLGAAAPGSAPPVINAGDVENKGFELLVAYNKELSDDFGFNMSYNFSTLNNEVLYVGSTEGFLEGGSFMVGENLLTSRMEAGMPIGYFYGYKTNGIYQNQAEIDALDAASPKGTFHKDAGPGDLKFVDTDGDGKISAADKTYIGDPIADMTMGLNLGFHYKNIDFSAAAFASLGNDMVRDYERKNLYSNKGTYVLDSWTTSNPSNTTPKAVNGGSINYDNFSDYFVEDASYLRIQNIQIGYTLAERLSNRIGIRKCRIYVSGNNLFTFTNYKGYDPSATGNGNPIGAGIDKGFYPVAKTYLLGINLNF
ncbi:TonB-dependent receptor [Flavicella sp.]|nr:TonB-dependent receptor [Flavicella sp.]